jgi:hypothetical protein
VKQYFLYLLIFFTCSTFISQYCCYQEIIQNNALIWKQNNIETLTNPDHLQTIIDIILLSYQLAQESCSMIIAKLSIEEEALKIYTPSLIDSWQTNMQTLTNDTRKIELALEIMKISQQKIKQIFEAIKLTMSRLIQVNPQPTQTLISHLKDGLILWTKQQCKLENEIDIIQQDFLTATSTISDLKTLFTTTIQNPEFKNNQLKQAAGCVSRSYKDIESVFSHFIQLRKKTICEMNEFFTLFFKIYYNIVYDIAQQNNFTNLKTVAYEEPKLPNPNAIFYLN